jgi:hypothetical protein
LQNNASTGLSVMTQANLKDSPQERLIHYLEMASKAHESARNPAADLQVRNLYSWVAKSWEMLAMDELDKMRSTSRNKPVRRRPQLRGVPTHGRNDSKTRLPGSPRLSDRD